MTAVSLAHEGEGLMVSLESPVPSLSQPTDLGEIRRRGLELFCLSFLALFLELMVIRSAPSVSLGFRMRLGKAA